jgi:hypothetical protein
MGKLKGVFRRVFKPNVSLNTLGELLRAFRKLSFLRFYTWLKDHCDILLEYFPVKKPIFA